MSNTYYKILNKSINDQYIDEIITDVQNKSIKPSYNKDINIYDMVKDINGNTPIKNVDFKILLKHYVVNQILKENNKNIKNDNMEFLTDTANPNIKIHKKDNIYYKLKQNKFIKDEKIETVNKDGTFIIIETTETSSYKTKIFCDINGKIQKIQLINPNGKIEKNKWHAAEILCLKKEYAQKFKYTGYSGNSSDIVATILNKLNTAKETGNYMDKHCQLYRWEQADRSFVRNLNAEAYSPLLTDYEFTNNVVIRKEYIGINE